MQAPEMLTKKRKNTKEFEDLNNVKKQRACNTQINTNFKKWLNNVKRCVSLFSGEKCDDVYDFYENESYLHEKFTSGISYTDVAFLITEKYNCWKADVDKIVLEYIGTDRSNLPEIIDVYEAYMLGHTAEEVAKKIYENNYDEWTKNIWLKMKNHLLPKTLFVNNETDRFFSKFYDFVKYTEIFEEICKWCDKESTTLKNAKQLDDMIFDIFDITHDKIAPEILSPYIYSINLSNVNFRKIKNYIVERHTKFTDVMKNLNELCGPINRYQFTYDNLDCAHANYHLEQQFSPLQTAELIYKKYWEKRIENDFKKWYNKVDLIVFNKIGYRLTDLPDENYRFNFENNCSEQNMARKVIGNYYDELNFILAYNVN